MNRRIIALASALVLTLAAAGAYWLGFFDPTPAAPTPGAAPTAATGPKVSAAPTVSTVKVDLDGDRKGFATRLKREVLAHDGRLVLENEDDSCFVAAMPYFPRPIDELRLGTPEGSLLPWPATDDELKLKRRVPAQPSTTALVGGSGPGTETGLSPETELALKEAVAKAMIKKLGGADPAAAPPAPIEPPKPALPWGNVDVDATRWVACEAAINAAGDANPAYDSFELPRCFVQIRAAQKDEGVVASVKLASVPEMQECGEADQVLARLRIPADTVAPVVTDPTFVNGGIVALRVGSLPTPSKVAGNGVNWGAIGFSLALWYAMLYFLVYRPKRAAGSSMSLFYWVLPPVPVYAAYTWGAPIAAFWLGVVVWAAGWFIRKRWFTPTPVAGPGTP